MMTNVTSKQPASLPPGRAAIEASIEGVFCRSSGIISMVTLERGLMLDCVRARDLHCFTDLKVLRAVQNAICHGLEPCREPHFQEFHMSMNLLLSNRNDLSLEERARMWDTGPSPACPMAWVTREIHRVVRDNLTNPVLEPMVPPKADMLRVLLPLVELEVMEIVCGLKTVRRTIRLKKTKGLGAPSAAIISCEMLENDLFRKCQTTEVSQAVIELVGSTPDAALVMTPISDDEDDDAERDGEDDDGQGASDYGESGSDSGSPQSAGKGSRKRTNEEISNHDDDMVTEPDEHKPAKIAKLSAEMGGSELSKTTKLAPEVVPGWLREKLPRAAPNKCERRSDSV